jgi:hypothetical protein
MLKTVTTMAGAATIAADEPGVVPGVVRVKVGFFPLFFSAAEARAVAAAALEAADAADRAKAGENRMQGIGG